MSIQLNSNASLLSTYLPVLFVLLVINTFVLWRRYRSRQLLLQRVAELEELSTAGRAMVAAELDFEALCELIVAETDKVIDTRTFQLGVFEEDLYHLQVILADGVRQSRQTVDLSDGRGLVRWVRDNRRSLLIRDFQREQGDFPVEPHFIGERPTTSGSALLIPMILGEEVIGVLAAHSNAVNHFDEQHERKLTILANQAAAALANSRLFTAERQRAAHIELIGNITHQINAIEDVDELFAQVVELTRKTFGFYQVNIYGVYKPKNLVVMQASSVAEFSFGEAQFSIEDGLIGRALREGRTIIDNNVIENSIYIDHVGNPVVDDMWSATRASLVTPLVVDGEIWGVLEVLHDKIGVFTQQEKFVVEALASGVSIAIQKARQLARQQEQAWLTAARLQVAEMLNRSQDLERAGDGVTRLVMMLTGVDVCGILRWDAELEHYIPVSLNGARASSIEKFYHAPWPLGSWSALDAVHVGQAKFRTQKHPPWHTHTPSKNGANGQTAAATGLTLMPLMAAEDVYQGVLFVSQPSRLPIRSGRMMLDDPDGRRHELIHSIAGQTAATIERFQLRQAQEEEAWVNTALLQVADAVNSMIDLNEILATIVRFVPILLGVKSCVVLIREGESELFKPGPSFGLSEMGLGMLATLELTTDDIDALAAERPRSFEDRIMLEHFALQMPHWLRQTLDADYGHGVPLHSQGRKVGVMLVGVDAEQMALPNRAFSGRQLNILFGIAQQAAAAVINNQLYAETEARKRIEQEVDVARRLQISLLPDGDPHIPNCQIASYWDSAREVSGDFYDFFQLKNGHWAIAVADVADKGVPASLYMAVSRTILRAAADTRTDPAEILTRTNELLINNTNADQFVTIFLAVWDAEKRLLSYTCGGHNPPVLLKRNGRQHLLQTKGMILGMIDEAEYETVRVSLEPQDVVIFYTDGVTEAINVNYDEFGFERMCLTAKYMQQMASPAILDGLASAVIEHAAGTPQSDDMTIVVMKVTD